jgi:hypothetical protein
MKNKQAALGWKGRFAEDLLQIRLKVVAEKKALAAQPGAVEQKRRKHFYQKKARECPLLLQTGGSKYYTNASFAAALRDWWASQTRFQRQQDLARLLEVDSETLSSWLNSRKFPRPRFCAGLYRITELECFSPAGQKAARREHRANKVKQ